MDRQRPLDFNYHHHHNYNPPPNYPTHYPHHNNFTPPPPPNFPDHHHHHPHHQNYNQPPPPNYYNHPPPPPPPGPPPPPYYGDNHHHDNHYYNDYNQPPPNYGPGPYPNQFNNQNSYGPPPPNFDSGYFMNGEPHGGFGGGAGGGGGGFHVTGRKRGHDRDFRGPSQDHPGGPTNAKLYLAPVPCTKTEEDLRTVFEEHGIVVEVIIPKDKWIDPQQGYCFVKYAKLEEADRAIMALNNQYTFSELGIPIKVKYADGDRERIVKPEREQAGPFLDKLYVGCLSKLATKREIEEIFSPYGYVEDVYIALDHLRQSRGYAFVKYASREMALAAINALHGTFTMRGCEQPLIVRFADPKKPRNGEFRPAHNFGDFHGGSEGTNAFEPTKVNSVNAQATVHRNCEPVASSNHTEESHPLIDQPPSNLPQMASQNEINETEKQRPNSGQEQETKLSLVESEHNGKNPQEGSVPSTASDVPSDSNILNLDPEECDWSEHTCPDGYKYYYNCETYESRWDKPEEFTAFQKRILEQQKTSQKSNEKADAVSPNDNGDEIELTKREPDNVCILSETSQVVDSTCV